VVETTPPEPSPEKANAALDRIEMPPDAVERIAELLTPGSSLIVSDYGISSESGPDTDFIVETRSALPSPNLAAQVSVHIADDGI
jgi:hypothetical protein